MTGRTPIGPWYVWGCRHRSLAEIAETDRLLARNPDTLDESQRLRLRGLLIRSRECSPPDPDGAIA